MGKASRQKREKPVRSPRPQRVIAPRSARPRFEGSPVPFWWHLLAAATIAAASIVLYQPSLSGEFVFDDHNAIKQSLLVRDIFPLARFVQFSNRPFTDLTLALDYAWGGGYEPWAFHITSILIHALNGLVLYLLILRTLGLATLSKRYGELRQPISWAGALLFTVHPFASEGVAYVSSRSEAMMSLFVLLTMLVYAVAATTEGRARFWSALAIPVTTVCALASKEIAAILPPALLLYDFVFVAGGEIRSTRTRWRLIVLPIVPLALGGLYLVVRAFLSKTTFAPYSQSAGFGFERYGVWEYLMTQVGVMAHYLRKVVVPTGLNFDHDWPLQRSFFDRNVLLPLASMSLLTLCATAYVRKQPVFSFAVLFMLLVLAPTSSIMPLADIAVERRMYLPLAGFAFLIAATCGDLATWIRFRWAADSAVVQRVVFATLAIVPIIVFAPLTHARAVLWGDHVALHRDGIEKSPGSPRVRLNLGVIYLNSGDYESAYSTLFEAKELYDVGESIHAFERIGAFIYYNLGAILFIFEEHEEAEKYLVRSMEIGARYVALRPMAHSVLGHITRGRGDWAATEIHISEALRFNQDHPEWLIALAEAQLEQNKIAEARKTMFRLTINHPEMRESPPAEAIATRLKQFPRSPRANRPAR